jgi:hypothetical protein
MVLTAGIVVTAAMITEHAGPFIGALFLTLPVAAGPTYVFLAIEQGPEFISQSAIGSLVITAANGIFCVVYARLAQNFGVVISLGATLAVWTALALAARSIQWTLGGAILLNAVVYAASLPLVARLRHVAMRPVVRRWYDIPLRALLVSALVAATLGLSTRIGPSATGILAVSPVALTSLILILQPRVGGPATAAVMANALTGLIGFASALVVLHLTAVPLGATLAILLWLAVCMGWNLGLWALPRVRRPWKAR